MNNRILRRVFEVFPKSDPPRTDEITPDVLGDSIAVRSNLIGVKWWEAERHTLDAVCDKIALLTPIAFHYYFPGFVIHSIKDFTRANSILEFTVYNLCPIKMTRSYSYFYNRFTLFSDEQVDLVRMFLRTILADPSLYSYYNEAERGLRKFWVLNR